MDRLHPVVMTYAKLAGTNLRDRYDIAITDLLTDLRHYCDLKGLPFEELNIAASDAYAENEIDFRNVHENVGL
jgi:hypothetical protein